MKDLHARKAIDKTSALVTSKGPDYQLTKFKPACPWDTATPHPITECPDNIKDLTGEKLGRMIVLGYHSTRTSGRKNTIQHTRWVVRCACGMYSLRTNKSIERKSDSDHCCDRCDYLKIIRKRAKGKADNSHVEVEILPLPENNANTINDIIGEVFDYLRVIGYGGSNGRGAKWVVQCILCGGRQYKEARDLRKGRTKCNVCS